MATEIHMPQWGTAMREGVILTWRKGPGDRVEADEVLVEVEDSGTAREIVTPVAGTVLSVHAAVGAAVPVRERLALVGEPDERGPS